jgi:hypothetical protein
VLPWLLQGVWKRCVTAALKAAPQQQYGAEAPVQQKLQDTRKYLQEVLKHVVNQLADETASNWTGAVTSLLTGKDNSLLMQLHLECADRAGRPYLGCLPNWFWASAESSRRGPLTRRHT